MRTLLLIWLPLFLLPGATLHPQPTPFPTPSEPAQEFTFTDVGNYAPLVANDGETIGIVIVAGLQTIIIRDFRYDGPVPASVVLTGGTCHAQYVYGLMEIRGTHRGTFLLLHPPAKLRNKQVDTILVCANGEIQATTGAFPPPRGYNKEE